MVIGIAFRYLGTGFSFLKQSSSYIDPRQLCVVNCQHPNPKTLQERMACPYYQASWLIQLQGVASESGHAVSKLCMN